MRLYNFEKLNGMKKKTLYIISSVLGALLFMVSCTDDLNTLPIDKDEIITDGIYQDFANYKNILAKCYMGLATGGNEGGDGAGDISGIDGGFSSYMRQYWYHQELTTDEAVIGWNDQTIKDFHYHQWTSSDVFVAAMYYRIFFQISLANEFLRNTTNDKLSDRGISSDNYAEVSRYRAEVRFLRALSYYHALDMFRNVPFVKETDGIGAFFPDQATPTQLFTFIESELNAITDDDGEDDIMDARTNEYARADKGAAYMLLAKLYLNAEVYIQQKKYTEAITAVNKVIAAGYSLEDEFQHLFMTDNNTSNEIIFPVAFDGLRTQTWGGTTLLVHAAIGGDMTASDYGVGSGWGGLRTTKEYVGKFSDITGATDSRAIFFTNGQDIEINDIGSFNDGYATPKFVNTSSTGQAGQHQDFVDTDFPMFRLADAYLMYAEAVVRGGTGGDLTTALGYVNDLRERAYGDASGNITSNELTLDFLIDERARELFWEGHRRTDLVRFGLFTGGKYLWTWKGRAKDGRSTESHRDIFPLPSDEVTSNPNLDQNPKY